MLHVHWIARIKRSLDCAKVFVRICKITLISKYAKTFFPNAQSFLFTFL